MLHPESRDQEKKKVNRQLNFQLTGKRGDFRSEYDTRNSVRVGHSTGIALHDCSSLDSGQDGCHESHRDSHNSLRWSKASCSEHLVEFFRDNGLEQIHPRYRSLPHAVRGSDKNLGLVPRACSVHLGELYPHIGVVEGQVRAD
jgi:hypothetical protein